MVQIWSWSTARALYPITDSSRPQARKPVELDAKDDPHGQTIALLGQYMASSFVLPSDGHSATTINDPQDQQHHLSLPHAG